LDFGQLNWFQQMKTHYFVFVLALIIAGCSPSKFDRAKAKTLLDAHLSQSDITEIRFTDSGFKQAQEDQLIDTKRGQLLTSYSITDKGMDILGDLIGSRNLNTLTKERLMPKSKVGERIASIDGIADAGNGQKLVEFTTCFIFPANTSSEASRYLYTGRKGVAAFALYDDGWRIVRAQF